MLEVKDLVVEDKHFLGVRISLPVAPLLLIKGGKGFVMCGYLNIEAVNHIGDAAAKVSGVNSFEDVLEAEVKAVSDKARALGVQEGMSGAEALVLLY